MKTSILVVLGAIASLIASGASLPSNGQQGAAPTATASVVEANFCFVRARGVLPERLPPPTLVLNLKLQVAYHDPGSRPLIMPLGHELTVYTSLAPGVMKVLGKPMNVLGPSSKAMEHLPADVSADNPVDPKNDVFDVIPSGGDMNLPVLEEIAVPIYKKSARSKTDLRGRRLYMRLQLDHQAISPSLEAALSDRWTRLGVPWTGRLRTNTLMFDIPSKVEAKECVDTRQPDTVRHVENRK